jgi:hypothetical protein
MVRDTSIKTYHEILDEGLLGVMEEKVFNVILQNPDMCDREYSEISNFRINQITGRRNGLVEQGCVVESGRKVDIKTNRTVITWKVPDVITYKNMSVPHTRRVKCGECKGKGYILVKKDSRQTKLRSIL